MTRPGLSHWLLIGASWLWVALLAAWTLAVGVAEARPLTGALLYMPTLPALGPLPLLAGWMLVRRRYAALLPLAVGTMLCLHLLAIVVPRPGARMGGPQFRIFTVNAWGLSTGPQGLAADLLKLQPDVVLMQSTHRESYESLNCEALKGFHFARLGQFSIASRWPIEESEEARDFHTARGAPWARWTLHTPWGLTDVFEVHPQSPHQSLGAVVRGLVHGLTPEEVSDLQASLMLLDAQVRSLSAAIAHARHPFIVAGDTNLPPHSRIFSRELGRLHDAFTDAGGGTGYTYPCHVQHVPSWLRLDRVLTGGSFRAVSAHVGRRGLSTHCSLTVDLVRVNEPSPGS